MRVGTGRSRVMARGGCTKEKCKIITDPTTVKSIFFLTEPEIAIKNEYPPPLQPPPCLHGQESFGETCQRLVACKRGFSFRKFSVDSNEVVLWK